MQYIKSLQGKGLLYIFSLVVKVKVIPNEHLFQHHDSHHHAYPNDPSHHHGLSFHCIQSMHLDKHHKQVCDDHIRHDLLRHIASLDFHEHIHSLDDNLYPISYKERINITTYNPKWTKRHCEYSTKGPKNNHKNTNC